MEATGRCKWMWNCVRLFEIVFLTQMSLSPRWLCFLALFFAYCILFSGELPRKIWICAWFDGASWNHCVHWASYAFRFISSQKNGKKSKFPSISRKKDPLQKKIVRRKTLRRWKMYRRVCMCVYVCVYVYAKMLLHFFSNILNMTKVTHDLVVTKSYFQSWKIYILPIRQMLSFSFPSSTYQIEAANRILRAHIEHSI